MSLSSKRESDMGPIERVLVFSIKFAIVISPIVMGLWAIGGFARLHMIAG